MSEKQPESGSQKRKHDRTLRTNEEIDDQISERAERENTSKGELTTKLLKKMLAGKSFQIPLELDEEFTRYCQSKHLPKDTVGPVLLAQGMRADIYDPEWAKKIKERQNNFEFLTWCLNIGWDEKDYVCVHSRIGRSPEVKTLGKTEIEARTRCALCIKDRDTKDREADLLKEIETLKIGGSKTRVVQVPSCVRGGRLSDDGKSLYCQMAGGDYRKVDKCKTLRNGANCKDLRWTQLEVAATEAWK